MGCISSVQDAGIIAMPMLWRAQAAKKSPPSTRCKEETREAEEGAEAESNAKEATKKISHETCSEAEESLAQAEQEKAEEVVEKI